MSDTDSELLIVKHRHERFTIVAKRITDGDTGLSLRATGLLCYLLGKPGDWKTWSRQLAEHWRCSRTVILAILHELQQAGYAELAFKRDKQGRLGGKFWRISDMPEFGPAASENAQNAIKIAPGTDGLLSRTSEKSEHRKSSPIQKTDLWTEQPKKKEKGGVPPLGPPSSSFLPQSASPEPQPVNYSKDICSKALAGVNALCLAYQARAGLAYASGQYRRDLPKALECHAKNPTLGHKAMVRAFNSAWFLTDGYEPVYKNLDGSERFEPFFNCHKVRHSLGYLYDHLAKVLAELKSEAAERRRHHQEKDGLAQDYETIWWPAPAATVTAMTSPTTPSAE